MGSWFISGNECVQGEEYAKHEITDPRRYLTTTVIIKDGVKKLLPVRSEIEIPKNLIIKGVKELSTIEVNAPIKKGDIVLRDILNTNINIVACCDIKRKKADYSNRSFNA
jgi:CxxC motif-containing protein